MAQQSGKRRAATLASAVLYAVIVIAVLGTLNFLVNRYNKSFDSTANKRFTLSDQTAKIAKNLQQDVTITYWDHPAGFTQARDLLDRYQNLSKKIEVKYEDVDKRRTQAIAAGVKNPIPNIFVQVGNKKEDAKSLTEEEITGALVRVIKGGDRKVCFTVGSGEHNAEDTTPDGFSTAKQLTEKSNYKTEVIKLLPKPEIPMDCTIVVVPGPKHDYLAPEVAALKQYV
jgi:ABC-2 type transport system permease protein